MASRLARIALLALPLGAVATGCTVVKPIVCTFTYPVDEMAESIAVPDDPDDDHEEIPPPLVCVAAPVLVPLRFVGLALMGFAGGIVSGFASDLNVVLWNAETPWKNLTRPFHTNMKQPDVG
jgi:hypothetical protein